MSGPPWRVKEREEEVLEEPGFRELHTVPTSISASRGAAKCTICLLRTLLTARVPVASSRTAKLTIRVFISDVSESVTASSLETVEAA